jgi:hypothetical protein
VFYKPLKPIAAALILSSSAVVLPAYPAGEGDYAHGFELLRGLGIPSTENARWTKGDEDTRGQEAAAFSELDIELRGTVWALPDEGFLPVAALAVTRKADAAVEDEEPSVAAGILERMLKAHQEKNPEDRPAPIAEKKPDDGSALLKGDIELIIGKLSDSDVADNIRRYIEYGRSQSMGRMLIFAAQVDQAGHPELAHELADAVFSAARNRDAVIDSAISLLADDQYQKVWEKFREDHDWAGYHAAVSGLMEKFPRGWSSRAATAMLLAGLEKRAAKTPLPAIESPDIPLSPAALEILRRWDEPVANDPSSQLPPGFDISQIPVEMRAQFLAGLSRRSGFDIDSLGLWLLRERAGEDGEETGGEPEQKEDDPRAAITDLGMDAIPVLAALLGDSTLTHFPHSTDGGVSYFSSSEDEMTRTLRIYESMSRPSSRGEIARQLLAQVIPDEGDLFGTSGDLESSGSSAEDLRTLAIGFWKKHRGSDPVEISKAYLEAGNDSQKYYAGSHLISSTAPAARPVFEAAILASSEPLDQINLVESYLKQHKSAVRPFFEKFSALLREVGGDGDDSSLPWQVREAGGVEGMIKKLGIHVGASSVEELISSALNEDGEAEDTARKLATNLRNIPVADLIHPLAKALADAPEDRRADLVRAFISGLWGNQNRDDTPPEFSAEAAAAWSALLDDDSPIKGLSSETWLEYYDIDSTSSAAAFIVEMIADEEVSRHFSIHKNANNGDSGGIIPRRARARLAGKPVPRYTSSKGLPEDRIKEIQGLAGSHATPLELRKTVTALTPPEKAAWIEGIQTLQQQEEGEPAPTLLACRITITSITAPDDTSPLPADLVEKLAIEPGATISAGFFESSCRMLLEHAAAWSGAVIDIKPDPFGTGLAVSGRHHPDDGALSLLADHDLVLDSDADAFAIGIFYDSDEALIWAIKDGRIELLTELDEDEPEDERNPIARMIAQFEESKSLYFPESQLMVLQREDLAKYQTPDE